MEMPDKDKEAMSMKCRELSKLTVRDFVQSVYDETQWSQELRTRIGFPRYEISAWINDSFFGK